MIDKKAKLINYSENLLNSIKSIDKVNLNKVIDLIKKKLSKKNRFLFVEMVVQLL